MWSLAPLSGLARLGFTLAMGLLLLITTQVVVDVVAPRWAGLVIPFGVPGLVLVMARSRAFSPRPAGVPSVAPLPLPALRVETSATLLVWSGGLSIMAGLLLVASLAFGAVGCVMLLMSLLFILNFSQWLAWTALAFLASVLAALLAAALGAFAARLWAPRRRSNLT